MKSGIAHGSTDDFGYQAVDKKVHVHDLHATVLHLINGSGSYEADVSLQWQ